MSKKEESKVQDNSKFEFQESLELLKEIVADVKITEEESIETYLIYLEQVKVGPKGRISDHAGKQAEAALKLTVTNGLDKLYQLLLDFNYLEHHREKTGIEGSWQSFMSLMKSALDSKSLTLKKTQPESSKKQQMKQELIELKVHYPLMVGARLTGTFDLTHAEIKGRERHEIIQQILFKLLLLAQKERAKQASQVSIDQSQKLSSSDQLNKQFDNLNVSQLQDVPSIDEQKKRKPKGTLVAPYLKKRKVQGAKF